jgi:hypothetical protein
MSSTRGNYKLAESELVLGRTILLSIHHDDGRTSVLGSDGLRTNALHISTACDEGRLDVRRHLFRVCKKLVYQSQRDLAKVKRQAAMGLRGHGLLTGTSLEEAADREEEIDDLERRAQREREANKAAVSGTHDADGITILYGHIIQLQHVVSGKFITLDRRNVADRERDCLKVTLKEGGSPDSWFRVSLCARRPAQARRPCTVCLCG